MPKEDMLMVRLYVSQANAVMMRDLDFQRGLRAVIADNLSYRVDLDPDNDIDVRVVVSADGSHSKYDLTVDIETMVTRERSHDREFIATYIRRGVLELVGDMLTVNVWLKLVMASYAPED